MKLEFIADYLGRETAMKQYRKGDIDDFSHAQGLELIRLEVAIELLENEKPPRKSKGKEQPQVDGGEV